MLSYTNSLGNVFKIPSFSFCADLKTEWLLVFSCLGAFHPILQQGNTILLTTDAFRRQKSHISKHVQCSSVIAVCRNETTGNFVDIHERFGGIS
jgi:hypothetical protein